MGKKKIEVFKKIENRSTRYVTCHKRKKGLLKKAMELSILCQQEMLLVIWDKEQNKLVTYQSDAQFSLKQVAKLLDENDESGIKDVYTNQDYDTLKDIKSSTEKARESQGIVNFIRQKRSKDGRFQGIRDAENTQNDGKRVQKMLDKEVETYKKI